MTRLRSSRRQHDDPVLLTIRAGLDDPRELSQLLRRKTRLGTLRPVVEETLQTRPVEAMDPVAQRLAVQAADLRRFATIHPVADRRQRQQPSALVDVLRPPGQRPKLGSRIILSQSHPRRHPQTRYAAFNQLPRDPGISSKSQ